MKNFLFLMAAKHKSVQAIAAFLLVCGLGLSPQACGTKTAKKAGNEKFSFSVKENIGYKSGDNLDEYEKSRCKLDLYIPEGKKDFPVMVWFYGGSLKHGSKDDGFTRAVAKRFAGEGFGVAVVDYRLSPHAKYSAYIDDAAAAVAWAKRYISGFGGDPKAIFIAGHSAGGYLVYMLAMNPDYLKKYDMSHMEIAGVIAISGQTFTHYTIREERGILNPESRPVVDDGAPCYHARSDTPPILAVWADGDSLDRIEENKYLLAFLSTIGNKKHSSLEMKDRTHWTLIAKIPEQGDPLTRKILSFIEKNRFIKHSFR